MVPVQRKPDVKQYGKKPEMTIPDRKLGNIETIFHIFHEELFGGFAILCVPARIVGPLDIQLVKHACHHLYERHPLLRARIEKRGDGFNFIFDVPFPDIPVHSFFELGKTDVHTILEREADTLFETSKYLWRILLITDKGNSEKHHLILSLHRSISDRTNAVHLAQELIGYCSKIFAREIISVDPLPVRAPFEELAASMHGTGPDRPVPEYAISTMPFHEYMPLGRRHTRLREHVVEPADLEALHESCLREKTTFHAALAAMTMMAMQKQFREPVVAGISTPINIRKLTDPQIGNNEMGCLATEIRLGYDGIAKRSDLWGLARHYNEELARIASGSKDLVAGRDFDPDETVRTLRTAKQFLISCTLADIGQVDLVRTDPFVIESVGFFSSRQCAEQIMSISATIMRGALFLNFAYTSPLLKDSWANRFINGFLHLLDKAVK